MPKLYSSREIESVLLKIGFVFKSQKGSHGKFKHYDNRIVVLPMNKKEIPIGTFRSILKQINISLEEFEKLI
ncbi:MAG: type II toxin-antitoxin system HicA family toxin [Melioribacteraceae bacterium]|nr:type II toxin-antitoxin system HicA family toxin [Melioribacteraceae bacterium]